MTGRLAIAASDESRRSSVGGTAPVIAVAALTALGLALRLILFGDSLFGDELSSYAAASMADGPGDVVNLISGDTSVVELTPPLYFLLAWVSTKLGNAVELVRLPALIAGTLLIPATYALGVRTVGRRAGLLGAVVITIAPFLVFYSTDGRAYMLATLLVVLAALALLRAVERDASWFWWAAYAAASCAAVYSHYTVVFPLVVLVAWGLWAHRDRRGPLVLANLAAAVGFIPWIGEYRDDSGSPFNLTEALNPFGIGSMLDDFADWSLGMPPLADLDAVPGIPAIVLIGVGIAVAVVGLCMRLTSAGRPHPSSGLILVIGLALAAPVGMSLYSVLGEDILYSRILAVSWPGLALAVGALLAAARPPSDIIAAALVTAGLALGLVNSLDGDVRRPDYEGAARFIEAETTPDDPVYDIIVFGSREGPLATGLAVQLRDRAIEHPVDLDAAAAAAGAARVAVVTPGFSGRPPEAPAINGYSLAGSRAFAGAIHLGAYVYERDAGGG